MTGQMSLHRRRKTPDLQLAPRQSIRSAATSIITGSIGRTVLMGAFAACVGFVLSTTPTPWVLESLRVMGVGIILLFLFLSASRSTVRLRPAFVIWWLVLVSECIFYREGDNYANAAAFEGNFPAAAYSEVVGWVLCLMALLVCWERVHRYSDRLFTGDYKWLTLFAMVCVGSCIYTPRPLFGLAWAFKLSLVVLLLMQCSIQIHDFRDTVSFLRFTFWAYTLIVCLPVVLSIVTGSLFDDEGRMSTIVSPNALSPNAGVVLLLALTLFSKRKSEGMRKWTLLLGAVACVIMILAGSKTGILGGILSGTLFYLLRRHVRSAVVYVATATVLVYVLALATPLGDYFYNYNQSYQVATFTGRTVLWSAVLPAIWQRPILGHGYLASTFMEFQTNNMPWSVPHLHNGFLEVLYNNGLIGFLLIVVINVIIPRNLYRVLRRVPPADPIYRIGAGCLALYAHLFINGLFNASFGGQARPPFMLLLSLVVVSKKLLELVPCPPADEAAEDLTPALVVCEG
jgi:O-antigen ligase